MVDGFLNTQPSVIGVIQIQLVMKFIRCLVGLFAKPSRIEGLMPVRTNAIYY